MDAGSRAPLSGPTPPAPADAGARSTAAEALRAGREAGARRVRHHFRAALIPVLILIVVAGVGLVAYAVTAH